MKIKFQLLCLFVLPLAAVAQNNFTIKGYGKLLKDGDKIFLSYRQNGVIIDDSTTVKNGRFFFEGKATSVTRGYICRNDNPKYAEFLYDSFTVYIESGNIKLTSTDTLNNSLISGTKLNEDYAVLVAALQLTKSKRMHFKSLEDFSEEELKDTALVNLTKAKANDIYHESNLIRLNFIAQHPNSYVSLYNLSEIARSSKYLTAVEKCFANFSPALKNSAQGKDIAKRIYEGHKTAIGILAKDFVQPTADGKEIKLSDYKGKYILVDFWASWCLPCREENPNVLAMYQQYKAKNFTILSISIDTDKTKWINAIKEDRLPWKQVSDLKKENEAAKLYGITTIPANALIDPTGKIIAKDLKGQELREKLAELFNNN